MLENINPYLLLTPQMLKGCASDTALSKNQFYCIFLFMYLCEISWLFLNAFEAYNGVYG